MSTPSLPDAGDPLEPGDGLGRHAARTAGERLRELADAEHARVEADETTGREGERQAAAERLALAQHSLFAAGVEPITEAALAELGEQAADYRPCPFCFGFGAVEPDAMLAQLAVAVEEIAPFPQSNVFYRCAECNGWGRVLTGARLGEQGVQPCPNCDGRGYRDKRDDDERERQRLVIGGPPLVPAPSLERDPFTTPPPAGSPPAAGMVWDEQLGRWAYPAAVGA